MHVSDDPDDSSLDSRDVDPLADRTLIGPVRVLNGVADDDRAETTIVVVRCERASLDDGDTHGLEVAGRRAAGLEDGRELALDRREFLDEGRQLGSAGQRQRLDRACARRAGNGLQPLDEPLVELCHGLGLLVLRRQRLHGERQHIIRGEPGVDRP